MSRPACHLSHRFCLVFLALTSVVLAGCSVNPVTGQKELMLISEQQELSIGQEQYKPAQQSQGGLYTLDPELTIYVRNLGNKLARVSDRPDLPYEFVILNNSVPNAWALPSGKIAVNRGLLIELEDEAQLAAVIGHEIVHAAARHGAKRMQSGMIVSAGMAGLGLALKDHDYQEVLLGGAVLATNLTLARYSRENELESDDYGMRYMSRAGYDPQAAVELQQTFVRLSRGRESSWLSGLFASHPPSQERVDANRQHAGTLSGNYRGREAYQKAIGRLLRTREAYRKHDEGRALLAKGEARKAADLATEALKIEPEEALFYALRGEARQKLGQQNEALKDFDKAVALNPEYFGHYLNRGQALQAAGRLSPAESDLRKANALLPTSFAYLALGSLAEQRNDSQAAIGYYGQAAGASGDLGNRARINLAKLELPRQPDKYLAVRLVQDARQRRLVTIENASPVPLSRVTIEVSTRNARGQILERETLQLDQVPGRQQGRNGQARPVESALATRSASQPDRQLATRIVEVRLAQ